MYVTEVLTILELNEYVLWQRFHESVGDRLHNNDIRLGDIRGGIVN